MFGFFRRIKIGFGLARRSGRVLRAHPNLLLLPVIGGIAGLAFVATLFGTLYTTGLYEDPGPVLYAILFVTYVIETFIASFFSAALVAGTRAAFHGETPTVGGSLRAAWQHKLPLLVWSVIAATVGVVIKMIESQDNLIARILAGLFAVAWSVLTFFIIPVIVFEDTSVFGMFKESGKTFKDTWGESVGAMGAISIVTFLLALLGLGIAAAVFFVLPGSMEVVLLTTFAVGAAAVVFALLIGNSLTGIAKTALYVYATENTAPEHFRDMEFAKLGGDA